MIDPLTEELIPLREASAIFPRRRHGKRPHIATIYRYVETGYRGVRLEAMRAGGQLATSREAVARFLRKMTAADNGIHSFANSEANCQTTEGHLDAALDAELS